MKVLITGGAGYIGSTIASACLDAGITPVIVDDHSSGPREFVRDRIHYVGDVADAALLDQVFAEHEISAVVHCAALISVPESVEQPLRYYRTNIGGSVALIEAMIRAGVDRLVFSSSASVYATDGGPSVTEATGFGPQSPYAATKAMTEQVIADACATGAIRAISLRYFNPVGADPQQRTGPYAADPSHVLGKLLIAANDGTPFYVTGTDWPTRDGSGLRDYVHVWDLAQAHLAALTRFDAITTSHEAINLGSGSGTTVWELVEAVRAVTGRALEASGAPRRPGDAAGAFADITKARALLDWEPRLSVADGIRDADTWRATWESRPTLAP